jgi:hypothetical protein
MAWIIMPLQEINQNPETSQTVSPFEAQVADNANLPKNQGNRGVELAAADQKIGRFEALTAAHRWIDAKVGEQAIFGGNSRQHFGGKALMTSTANRFMRRINKYSGMAVKGCADI